ncbi:hypothetical protein KKC13_11435 [bacterium]|nr:hypothetical protein [bacterium]MBU1957935.1 hypothetical protein [bacterium]
MNRGKLLSGIAALSIYLGLIFLILFFYNIHKTKAKNYVEKNSDRVTVTLVNSDKTVLNRSDEVSNKNKPTPVVPPAPLRQPIKKEVKAEPKKTERTSKVIPKPTVEPETVPKKVEPKKIIQPKEVVPPKVIPKKVEPKKEAPKKVIEPKKVEPKETPPKKTQSAQDLFSSVKTKDVSTQPVKKVPTPVTEESSIKHNSSITDRIKSSHQSGAVSNDNREKGVQNAYIAKVKRHMNNWDAASTHKGQRVTIDLTIYNSGKFNYRITGGGYGNIESSLREYLDTLNRIGLGRHSKSTPYSIQVSFTVR